MLVTEIDDPVNLKHLPILFTQLYVNINHCLISWRKQRWHVNTQEDHGYWVLKVLLWNNLIYMFSLKRKYICIKIIFVFCILYLLSLRIILIRSLPLETYIFYHLVNIGTKCSLQYTIKKLFVRNVKKNQRKLGCKNNLWEVQKYV